MDSRVIIKGVRPVGGLRADRIPAHPVSLLGGELDALIEAAGCYVAECDELVAAGCAVDPKRVQTRDTLMRLLQDDA